MRLLRAARLSSGTRWSRSASHRHPACWAGTRSWDIFEVAWIAVAVAVAIAAVVVAAAPVAVAAAVAGSRSRRSAAAGNSA